MHKKVARGKNIVGDFYKVKMVHAALFLLK